MTKQQTAVEMLVEYMEANFYLTDESREVFKKALQLEQESNKANLVECRNCGSNVEMISTGEIVFVNKHF